MEQQEWLGLGQQERLGQQEPGAGHERVQMIRRQKAPPLAPQPPPQQHQAACPLTAARWLPPPSFPI